LGVAAECVSTFLMIHPFKDGNGRMSRLLLNHFLSRILRLPFPVVITSGHTRARTHWVQALRRSQKGYPRLLQSLMLQSVANKVRELRMHITKLPPA
jgi:Fic family protein